MHCVVDDEIFCFSKCSRALYVCVCVCLGRGKFKKKKSYTAHHYLGLTRYNRNERNWPFSFKVLSFCFYDTDF
jgi:hypothetical protein